MQGTSGADNQGIIDATHAYNNATPITFSSIESITMTAFDGADTFDIYALPSSIALSIRAGEQNDVINLAPSNPFGVAAINGPVDIVGNGGDDTCAPRDKDVVAIDQRSARAANETGEASIRVAAPSRAAARSRR